VRKTCEGCIDLAAVLALKIVDLQSHGASSAAFHFSQGGFGICNTAGLTSTATRFCRRTSSRRSSIRFAVNSVMKKLDAGQVAPGRARLATKPQPDRVFSRVEDDGDCRGYRLGRQRRWGTACRDDHGNLLASQSAANFRQAIVLLCASQRKTLRPSRPGEFHPEPLTDPDLTPRVIRLGATARRLPPSIEHRVPPVAGWTRANGDDRSLRSTGITRSSLYPYA